MQSDAIYLVILLNFVHHCDIPTSLRQNIFKYFHTAQKQSNIFKHFISLKIANLLYHTYYQHLLHTENGHSCFIVIFTGTGWREEKSGIIKIAILVLKNVRQYNEMIKNTP